MNCNLCPLGSLAITNCIQSVGKGKILVVVPFPTGEQDFNGDLMAGSHGRLLSGLLSDAGIRAEDYTLTGALRCGVPKTYTGTNQSIEACRTILSADIHRVRPDKIIAFGDIALRSLCRASGIKSKRGTELPLHREFGFSCPVYPTYSPSDVQRVPTYRRTVVADLRRVMRGEESEIIPFTFWSAA